MQEPRMQLSAFFPDNLRIFSITKDRFLDRERLILGLVQASDSARCPKCNAVSDKVHSTRTKSAQDLPILNRSVLIKLQTRRFFCINPECKQSIFIERTYPFIAYYGRMTKRCQDFVLQLATEMSCESAATVCSYLGIKVSPDTLLNLIKRRAQDINVEAGDIIGIDDWAYRRGTRYGTIICDLKSHRVIDVIEGRSSEDLERWLKEHPHITMISRDRASAYSHAVDVTLPDAIQIADRFHITKNLLDALKEMIKGYFPHQIEIEDDIQISFDQPSQPSNPEKISGPKKKRSRKRAKKRRKISADHSDPGTKGKRRQV